MFWKHLEHLEYVAFKKVLVPEKLLPKRSCSVITSDNNNTFVRNKDTKEVHTISPHAEALPEDIAKRYNKKESKRIKVNQPFSNQEYNKCIGVYISWTE